MTSLSTSSIADTPPIKPKPLQPGDTIALIAPAYPLNEERVERMIKSVEKMGFKVKYNETIFTRRGYLAGDDQTRADEFMKAWLDPEVDAVWPGTGGYGTTRMIDLLDYDAIAANPKIFIGFSDITGTHLAIQKKSNLVTFHSPNPQYGLGSENGLHEFADVHFWRPLLKTEYFDNAGDKLEDGYTFDFDGITSQPEVLVPGVASGRLTGGNLSLIHAVSGTPYEMDTEGRIVFFEDVGEAPYRIDRMFSNLRLAGKLDNCAAVLLGHWRNCEADNPERSLSLDEVFNDYFGDAPYPVIKNFPVGHVRLNGTLPMSVLAEINTETMEFKILEDPVDLAQ
jgi:muramoyltetrapeptide carboxypeptidase